METWKGFPVITPDNASTVLQQHGVVRWEEIQRWAGPFSYTHEGESDSAEEALRLSLVRWFVREPKVIRFKTPDGKEDDYFIPSVRRRFVNVLPRPYGGKIILVGEFHGEENQVLITPVSRRVPDDQLSIEIAVKGWRLETRSDLGDPTLLATVARDDGDMQVVMGDMVFSDTPIDEPVPSGEVRRALPVAISVRDWIRLIAAGNQPSYNIHVAGVAATLVWLEHIDYLNVS